MIIGKNFKARVVDVFKAPNGQHIHQVRLLDGVITKGDECELIIDKERRKRIETNHSSCHILQYALQQVISKEIHQAGSYVDQDKVRFDFNYSGKMTDDKIIEVENFINNMIKENLIVSTETLPLEKAKQLGAMALFGEKYKDMVRVVKIGKSLELCGGTHTTNTSEIGPLAIYSCESKGSNVYRIEATTGERLEQILFEQIKPYNDEIIKLLLKAKEIDAEAKKIGIRLDFNVDVNNDKPTSYKDIIYKKNELQYIHDEVKKLEKTYYNLKEKQSLNNLDTYRENIKEYNSLKYLIKITENKDVNILKSIADTLINEITNALVVIVNKKDDDSLNIIIKSNSNVEAGKLIKDISVVLGGNGGGSKTFAQGGAKSNKSSNDLESIIEKAIKENA